MNKLDIKGICPKCGNDSWILYFKNATASFVGGVELKTTEHIQKVCSRCDFTTKEAPLDAKD